MMWCRMMPNYSSWIHTSPISSSAVKSADSPATGIFSFMCNGVTLSDITHKDNTKVKNSSKKVAENFAEYKIMSIFALEISQTLMPRWRNRQTRWSQTPVGSPLCRFDPGSGYSKTLVEHTLRGFFYFTTPKLVALWSHIGRTLVALCICRDHFLSI